MRRELSKSFRLSEEEMDLLRKAAREAYLSPGAFIRQAALSAASELLRKNGKCRE